MGDTTVRMKGGVVQATTCIGYKVVNPRGEHLGKIEDLLIDLHEGFVAAAILSFGGFLGLGNKLFAVPLTAMTFHPAERKFVLDLDKEVLKNAPGFDPAQWPRINDRLWARDVYSYYGYPPYWQ
jgi:sporulation protein YlmC with PRC-barrel domain